mmetsp:Transcript_11528/g.18983  ORF Transcript_11528/g.18983 Transcript_11528/m.18983 type:complete len:98 (+) Transcript_11528:185-478(+)
MAELPDALALLQCSGVGEEGRNCDRCMPTTIIFNLSSSWIDICQPSSSPSSSWIDGIIFILDSYVPTVIIFIFPKRDKYDNYYSYWSLLYSFISGAK